jgi:threonine dehydratase
VFEARRRLAPHLVPTPLRHSAWLSDATGGQVALKLESLNPTGSFKIRGALNALLTLSARRSSTPPAVVTASAGNHGQALARVAAELGMSCVVFTPANAPDTKSSAIHRYGAMLRNEAVDYDEAERQARGYARQHGAVFVSPYNDADVIAGAGTIGLEIIEASPAVETVIVPIGGGGLASGVGLALEAASRARLVGVEVEASCPFTVGLARGAITRIQPRPTLADGLAGNLEEASITFPLVQRLVDEVVIVSEDELADAIRGLAAQEHLIAEGAAAVGVAAMLSGKVRVRGERVAAIITGANIHVGRLRAVLE